MDIKCIALDLDCTTLDAQGRLSLGNRDALEYAIAKGVHVVIASGRPFDALPQDVITVPGIEYAITANGAAVYHLPTARRLRSYTLTPGSVRAILQLTECEPISMELFVEGLPYADADFYRNPGNYGLGPRGSHYIQSTRRPVEDIRAFILSNAHRVDSLNLVVPNEADKSRLWGTIQANVPDVYVTSSTRTSIEISHKDAGKHSGVRFVTELLGIASTQTAAFGDGDNDADMLTWAGCGIAMENGTPACRAAADHVTCHHDHDGVAWGIYHIIGL